MDSHRPTVSVVIPAYNVGSFIRSAIGSVLNQTYQDFELLVVDDGSTDETAEVVKSFGSRVRCIYQANGGLAAARNSGILGSSGEILTFLDADDVWMPDLLKMQVATLSTRPDVDGVYAWAQFVEQNGEPLSDNMRPVPAGDSLRRVFLGGNSVVFSMIAVRRVAFQKVGLFDPTLRQAEDWDMLLRMAAAGIRFACVPRLLVQRRVHPGSLSADTERMLHSERLVLHKALSTLPLPPDCSVLGPAASFRILLKAAMGFWRQGARQPAVERLLEGFVAWPEALHRPQTYLGVMSRLQPSGYRSDKEILRNLERLADEAIQLLHGVFRHPDLPPAVRTNRRAAWSVLYAVLALLFGRKGRWGSALRHALRSIVTHPVPPLKGAATMAYQAAIQGRKE